MINLPQPVQKSKEWFDMRNNMLTASNCGAAIGQCKYSSIKETVLEKLFGRVFKENRFVYHGKKYEKIAIMIYEIIYNSKVGEFGLIQHPKIPYLGASPDGISMSLTLDGKMNKLMGRMLEIKCPPSRAIQNNGKIKGDICPDYYWIQVQMQLECCDLPECDFWQCHLIEYSNEKEFFNDDVSNAVHSDNQILIQDTETVVESEPEKIVVDLRIRRGALIELLPINRSKIPKEDLVEWYGKYIYPPTILMTPAQYKVWWTNTLTNIKTLYPDLVKDYKFSRIVFWKLELSHNELITRQTKWFDDHKLLYEQYWNRILYYRDHLDEAKEDIKEQRLSDEVFLYTPQPKIPKIKSISQFKKDLANQSDQTDQPNSVFIKQNKKSDQTNSSDTNSEDMFLTSSDKDKHSKSKQAKTTSSNLSNPTSKSKQTKTNNKAKPKANIDDDVFLSSDSPKNIKSVQAVQAVQAVQTVKPQQTIKAVKPQQLVKSVDLTEDIIQPKPLFPKQIKTTNSTNSTNSTNPDIEDEVLDLVMIMENRKKKNMKKT